MRLFVLPTVMPQLARVALRTTCGPTQVQGQESSSIGDGSAIRVQIALGRRHGAMPRYPL